MPLPLILGAIAGARAIYGAVSANQQSQRNKGYINSSYDTAKARLDRQQTLGRQSMSEEMSARGLGGISPIQSALLGSRPGASAAPHTLGEQLGADNETQYGLEQKDLVQQRDRALQDNRDQRNESYIGSAFAGANLGAQAYGLSQERASLAGSEDGSGSIADASTPAAAMSPIQRAMMPARVSSLDDPANHFGGIHPINPLGASASTWNSDNHSTLVAAPGQTNSEFHVG